MVGVNMLWDMSRRNKYAGANFNAHKLLIPRVWGGGDPTTD